VTPNRAKDINFSGYSKRTDTNGNVNEGEVDQMAAIGLYQSQKMIERVNPDSSFSTPTHQRSVLIP
jgi:hypothetical protein